MMNEPVSSSQLGSMRHLLSAPYLAIDTETTGLRPYQGDHLFSIIIATGEDAWYFDLKGYSGAGGDETLVEFLRELIVTTPRVWFMHNAKFDMAMLEGFGLPVHRLSTVHDTAAIGRLVNNDHQSYSLDSLAELYLGERKDDAVAAYVKKHGCGYQDVPHETMIPYAKKDALLTYRLGVRQLELIREMDDDAPNTWQKVETAAQLQYLLTWAVYDMVKYGVRIDREYCKEAIEFEKARMEAAELNFFAMTGKYYKASTKLFLEVLGADKAGKSKKGGASFNKKVIHELKGDNPIADLIAEQKDAKARIDAFRKFLKFADDNDVVHPDLNETGASTLRFSSSNPNMQNLKRPDDGVVEAFPVRRAIIPHTPDYCIVPIDYSQQEMRLMLDYAAPDGMIDAIRNGADIHQVTADRAGITRTEAKKINFGIIYGMGVQALAKDLGVSKDEAEALRNALFMSEPKILFFIKGVERAAKARGFVFSWGGTRFRLPVSTIDNLSLTYLMPNRLIQGGSAEITKWAIVAMHSKLVADRARSFLCLTIHDEIVLMCHKDELHYAGVLKDIMERVYPYRHLPMVADVSHSWVSLADKVKGLPTRRGAPQTSIRLRTSPPETASQERGLRPLAYDEGSESLCH